MRLVVLPAILSLLVPQGSALAADGALNAPAPLVKEADGLSPGKAAMDLAAAQRAQQLGFPAVAAGLYRALLASGAGDRGELTLALATALIDAGSTAEAGQVLAAYPAPRGPAWHLRMALVATQQSRRDAIEAELNTIQSDRLGADDRPWYFLLRGMVAASRGDSGGASALYRRAESVAPNEMARARFALADEEARLNLTRAPSKGALDDARQRLDQLQGTEAGRDQARVYAGMLNAAGRKGEAVAVLQRQIATLAPEERAWLDDFRLLTGLIGGAADGAGRAALLQLLETGDAAHQRSALALLARASEEGAGRSSFRAELGRLAPVPAAAPASPVRAEMLLYRAEFALQDRDYQEAERCARALLDEFPASELDPYALGAVAGVAWEERRFRAAAAAAQKAREAAPAGELRSRYAVAVAEAWFRAEDFPSSADAYASALRETPSAVPPGALMFQRIEAEISAGALDAAERIIGEYASDPGFDPVSRWQAEWNLARALQLAGRSEEAYARVGDFLVAAAKGAAVPADLRVRMAWLQAKLSFDVRRYADTLRFTLALGNDLAGVDPALASEVGSSAALLKAQAYFALSLDGAARDALQRLRSDYPAADAAVYSYIIEAERFAARDQVVEALRLLNQLSDRFPSSPYAPYALYSAALLDERLGQEKNYREANGYLESLVGRYPDSYLVFYARLRQGDLMRELNEYAKAEDDYKYLVDHFPRHGDVALAQLALAECYDAESANDSSRAERAADAFSQLCEAVDTPPDVRVEAGFNLGNLRFRHNRLDEAQSIWWSEVVTPFLLQPSGPARLGATGRYWMSRTLVQLGDLERQRGNLDEAKRAWLLVLRQGLPYGDVARDRLLQVHFPESELNAVAPGR